MRLLVYGLLLLMGCVLISRVPPSFGSPDSHRQFDTLPRPTHTVIVWEENKGFGQIIGNPHAPFINRLAQKGALSTRAYGVAHPSEPNYLAFFSGSTQGLHDDYCPYRFTGPNLASTLQTAGLSFAVYAEDLPQAGYRGCHRGGYVRKHDPVPDWPTLPPAINRPMRTFPSDFSRLSTVSWIVPNLYHDMHTGSIAAADRWLKRHLSAYAVWARQHHSRLIVMWDEGGYLQHNHEPLIFTGAMVRPGRYPKPVNHYRVLRTLAALYDLPPLGKSAEAVPITAIWRTLKARRTPRHADASLGSTSAYSSSAHRTPMTNAPPTPFWEIDARQYSEAPWLSHSGSTSS